MCDKQPVMLAKVLAPKPTEQYATRRFILYSFFYIARAREKSQSSARSFCKRSARARTLTWNHARAQIYNSKSFFHLDRARARTRIERRARARDALYRIIFKYLSQVVKIYVNRNNRQQCWNIASQNDKARQTNWEGDQRFCHQKPKK